MTTREMCETRKPAYTHKDGYRYEVVPVENLNTPFGVTWETTLYWNGHVSKLRYMCKYRHQLLKNFHGCDWVAA